MRKWVIISALLLASTAAQAQAQTIDVGSALTANGISTGSGTGQAQPDAAIQAADGQQAGAVAQTGSGQPRAKRHTASRGHAGSRESADETKARRIAARYGVSW